MAEGTIVVQEIARTGLTPTTAAASADGDQFANDGQTFVRVVNGSGGAITVTGNSIADCTQGYDHDEPNAVSIADGAEGWFGPFPKSEYNDADGNAHITYSDVSTVTVAAYRLPSN